MTDALAALGVLSLVVSGQFNRWVSIAILIGLGLAIFTRDVWQRRASLRHLDTAALLAVLAVQAVRIMLDANVLDVLVEFAAALQIIRLATRKGAAHDQQVIVLALLHLIAGTVLGGGLGYGLCFLGVLIVAPGALVLSHLRREVEGNYRQGARDRTGLPVDVPRILRSRRVVGKSFLAVTCLLSIPICVFTAMLFVIFPRVGLSLLLLNRPTGRMIGFSGRVDLGEVGVLRSDPTLAMRVEIPELPEPPPPRVTLHLRGTALDAYDGRAWSQSEAFKRPTESDQGLIPIERFPDLSTDPVMRIDLEPIDPPVIFLPPSASGLRMRTRGHLGLEPMAAAYRGPEGELRYQPIDDRGLKYEVFLSRKRTPTFTRMTAPERSRYLALPSNLPERVRTLAEEWTKTATTSQERAQAIETRLRTEYRYDLASPSGRDKQPLDHFLFESKRGHCEFYSTAMAVMLRAVGVPSRNVTGFIGGTWNRFGRFYAVRQGDAHSWVEVYLDGRGWITYDPTPPADAAPKSELVGVWAYLRDFIEATSQRWDRHIIGYDLNQQVGLIQSLKSRYHKADSFLSAKGPRPRVIATVAGGALGAFGIAFLVMRRRGKRQGGTRGLLEARSPSAVLATSLYEALDVAMGAQGLARAPSTPPLRHAESLVALEHPLSAEIFELTHIYLRARFGGVPISDEEKREFERRVRALRTLELRARQGIEPPAARPAM
jgi:transglutaminase-like putative cysteine protease